MTVNGTVALTLVRQGGAAGASHAGHGEGSPASGGDEPAVVVVVDVRVATIPHLPEIREMTR